MRELQHVRLTMYGCGIEKIIKKYNTDNGSQIIHITKLALNRNCMHILYYI